MKIFKNAESVEAKAWMRTHGTGKFYDVEDDGSITPRSNPWA